MLFVGYGAYEVNVDPSDEDISPRDRLGLRRSRRGRACSIHGGGWRASEGEHLKDRFGYDTETIRLSEFLDELKQEGWLETVLSRSPECERIWSHMDAGDELRSLRLERGDARGWLACAATAEIATARRAGDDITEYGRAVHAEMSVLMAAVRVGSSVRGATLYCTTFPCHSCARPIVAAGIRRVVFVEAYPKSKAAKLHGDVMTLVDEDSGETTLASLTEKLAHRRTEFAPFPGVGPRRYFDLILHEAGDGVSDRALGCRRRSAAVQARGCLPPC